MRIAGLIVIGLVMLAGSAFAGPVPLFGGKTASPSTASQPVDPLGRGSPQGLATGLIGALAEADFSLVEQYFETDSVVSASREKAVAGTDLAKQFAAVLNAEGTIASPTSLTAEPAGTLNDGLAPDLEQIGTITANGQTIAMAARRVSRPGGQIWLVSADTLNAIPQLYETLEHTSGSSALIDEVPPGPMIGSVPTSNIAAVLLIALVAFAIATGLVALRARLLHRVRGEHARHGQLWAYLDNISFPLRMIFASAIFGFAVSARWLGLSLVARYYGTFFAQIVFSVAIAWLLWRSVDAVGEAMLAGMSRRGQVTAYSAVSLVKRALQTIFVIAFVLITLQAFGINVTAGLTALGIGGLAIALGAQKLFENLIGSLSLIADRPVRVGDFCQFGGSLGTVEDVGIRSTRIRTLDRTIVTIPNGDFSSLQIENYSARDRFWFHPSLQLRYETTPNQIRYLLQEVRAMLYAHPRVSPDPARVRFTKLNDHSLDIDIYAYVNATDYEDFLEVQEDLLLRCMEIVDAAGTGFAFPSQTLYVTGDPGIDAEKTERAEREVKARVDAGDMQVPRFDPDRIDSLRNTLDYPPHGSATGQKTLF